MLSCIHSDPHSDTPICDRCLQHEFYNQNCVIIAQLQRQLDLLERQFGYDNLPLFGLFPSQGGAAIAANTDYLLPAFEMGCVVQNIIVSTDATAAVLDVWLYHSSVTPSPLTVNTTNPNRQLLMRYQGTGTFPPIAGKITVPARGVIGVRFNALSGGTFLAVSLSYSRSEQTSIEWFRSQRAGRLG